MGEDNRGERREKEEDKEGGGGKGDYFLSTWLRSD